MYEASPHSKFDHVFAIIRLETDPAGEAGIDASVVTVTKVVLSMEAAEQEVERLNKINAGKGCLYFWQITRLETADRAGPEVQRRSAPALEPRAHQP
jgi:hypothetical protein